MVLIIFFSCLKKITSLKERLFFLGILGLQILFDLLFPKESIYFGISLISISQYFIFIRNKYSWIVPTIIISGQTLLVLISSIFTFDLWLILYITDAIPYQLYTNKSIQVILLHLSLIKKKYLLISIFTFVFITILRFAEQILIASKNVLVYSILCLVIIFIIILFSNYFHAKSKYYQQRQLTELIQSHLKNEKSYIALANEFKHDYKNILISLMGYLKNDQLDQAKDYLENILNYSSNLLEMPRYPQLFLIKIFPIQTLINDYIQKSLDNNITFDLQVLNTIDTVNIPLIDFIRSFSILLDNAVEAAKYTKKPSILVLLKQDDKETFILVKNSSTELNRETSQSLFTKNFSTKEKNQGLGLYIFSSILNRYNNASYIVEHDKTNFTVSLTLHKKA
ncbi:hypothetical protein RU98_GL002273 [Enterococcus caccae]|nr:hypothetical protein RU98_GL002273 [Enterococcus caccae]